MPDQIRVCDQNTRRIFVCLENTHGLARLDKQSFIVGKLLQRSNDRVIAIPIARCLAGSAIDHEIARTLAHFFVEIIHQHAHRGFLLPSLAGERAATGSAKGSIGGGFGFDRHRKMVLLNELGIQTGLVDCIPSTPQSRFLTAEAVRNDRG